jgi:hypothetical protein
VDANDTCTTVDVVSAPPSGTRFPLGSTDVVSTATDAFCNTATCTFRVTVVDTQRPSIICPLDVETTAAVCDSSATVTLDRPQAFDNCSTVTIGAGVRSDGKSLGSGFPIGLTTVTWTATDAAGNQTTCSDRIRVFASADVCHCNLTQGYWKTHPEAWPVNSLTLGTVTYTKTQCLAILNKSVKGNQLLALAHQLIAAKLNILSGSSSAPVAAAIAAADALIGNKVIPPIGNGKLKSNQATALTNLLDQYNSGLLGIPHCDDVEPVILTSLSGRK